MSFLEKISALIPFVSNKQKQEYFFALNISFEKLTAALWTIEGKELKILDVAEKDYADAAEITYTADSLLDTVLGAKDLEIQKILFGVPALWLSDDNLKDEYLKLLRGLVKELELSPLAYVATTSAINHLLEKQDGIPQTAILVGVEKKHLAVSVARAGKIDGVKFLERGENSGADIEKALFNFTDIETLPSKIFLYGMDEEALEKLKGQLLSFSWMAKLSFLHFPKIELLPQDLDIKSVCFAGAIELQSNVVFKDKPLQKIEGMGGLREERVEDIKDVKSGKEDEKEEQHLEGDNFGFVVGDIAKDEPKEIVSTTSMEIDNFEGQPTIEEEMLPPEKLKFNFLAKLKGLKKIFFRGKNYIRAPVFLAIFGTVIILAGAYLFLVKAQIKVFVEPKILEKEAQIIADPGKKEVLEDAKIIPAQIVETEVSGTAKESATGRKQIGDPAKGTVVLYNKTNGALNVSKGSVLTGPGSTKFTLDISVPIASQSARTDGISFGKATATVTAQGIGADGNIPSDSDLTVANFSKDSLYAKSEGNFSGGTSKEVTVVSSDDQKKLLALLASTLRKQAQQKLQEQNLEKKILEEALSEQILSKSYSKNINDQASEFSLSMTLKFKGTAFEDKDLKGLVGKLVTTEVPEGYMLNLQDTETQADVSKLEPDGRLVFLAKFRAKLMPKIDTERIKQQIRGRSVKDAAEKVKEMENILGSEIRLTPSLPGFLQRLPVLTSNITVETGLK